GEGRAPMDRELTGQARPLRGSAPPRAALRKASGRRARVLLVDHLGSARSVLAAVLGGAGYDVVLVASGPAAPAELERQGAGVGRGGVAGARSAAQGRRRWARCAARERARPLRTHDGSRPSAPHTFTNENVDCASSLSTQYRASASRRRPRRSSVASYLKRMTSASFKTARIRRLSPGAGPSPPSG